MLKVNKNLRNELAEKQETPPHRTLQQNSYYEKKAHKLSQKGVLRLLSLEPVPSLAHFHSQGSSSHSS